MKNSNFYMDYIIPLSDFGGPDFDYRVENINNLIEAIPNYVNIIIVEQTLNSNYTFTKFNNKINKINVSYKKFNKPWLYNIGVRNALTDKTLLAEADMFADKIYFDKLRELLDNNKQIANTWALGWNKLIFYGNKEKTKIQEEIKPVFNGPEGGIVYFNKEFYWSIGGMNEFIEELGVMDNEITRRAEYFTKTNPAFPLTVTHSWHPISKLKNGHSRDKNYMLYCLTVNNCENIIKLLKQFHFGENEMPYAAKIDYVTFLQKHINNLNMAVIHMYPDPNIKRYVILNNLKSFLLSE